MGFAHYIPWSADWRISWDGIDVYTTLLCRSLFSSLFLIFVYDFSRPSLFLSTIFVCSGFHSLTGFFLFIDSPPVLCFSCSVGYGHCIWVACAMILEMLDLIQCVFPISIHCRQYVPEEIEWHVQPRHVYSSVCTDLCRALSPCGHIWNIWQLDLHLCVELTMDFTCLLLTKNCNWLGMFCSGIFSFSRGSPQTPLCKQLP